MLTIVQAVFMRSEFDCLKFVTHLAWSGFISESQINFYVINYSRGPFLINDVHLIWDFMCCLNWALFARFKG